MKKDIHPEYIEARVTCSCGETFVTRSTKANIRVEICSKCHPFFTGKQKFVDTGGRVERFQRKYGMHKVAKEEETAAEAGETSEGKKGTQEPESASEELASKKTKDTGDSEAVDKEKEPPIDKEQPQDITAEEPKDDNPPDKST